MKNSFGKYRGVRLSFIAASILSLGLVLVLSLPGCRKDFTFDKVKSLTWNPYLAFPLVNDEITLRKVLTQGHAGDHLHIDESGNISILYYFNDNAFKLRPSDLIKLSPVSFSYLHQVTQAEQDILSTSDLPIPAMIFPVSLAGMAQDIRVDKITVKKGTITVNANHTFNNEGNLTVSILNATKNGLPFSFIMGPFVSGQSHSVVDISGVSINLTSTPNVIQAQVEGLLKKSSSPVAGDEIRSDFQISIDTIGWFEGFLGHQTFSQIQDTVRVNVFNNAYVLGDLFFMDPQTTITIINSIGIPAEITVEKLIAINNASGSTLDIASRLGSGAVFSVPSPLINATKPTTTTMYYTNNNTGNAMNDFCNLKPDNVAFQIKVVINPTGTPPNFFSDTSLLYDTLQVKLPLWGHFDHLTYADTFDFVVNKPEELEFLQLNTKIANGLPLTALMQLYFTDENYNKKDSLAGNDQLFIREAPVDPSTDLPYPGMYGNKDTTFILNTARMQNLENVKKLLVKAVLHSAQNGQINVKLKADQMLKLNFTAKARIKKTIEFSK